MVENNQNIETINTKKNSANITQFGITVKFKDSACMSVRSPY